MRLTLIILLPLLAIAIAAGLWQLDNARRTAGDVFDRSLLSTAIATANDVAISGGDALSTRTRDILSDTSGGRVYYHVYGPDGVIVAGYATPPVGIPKPDAEERGPVFFAATYLGRPVRGVRLQNAAQIDGFSGIFTTTVWQDTDVRSAFVRDLLLRSLITICGLIASLALVVWFGVRMGLSPLLDLQSAIKLRSSDELSPIRRAVPVEVKGIVETLNSLFSQVSRSMTAQGDFISNAAHQLRNPIAGVLSLAEAVHSAPNEGEAKRRSEALLRSARETAELTEKLLTYERAKNISPDSHHEVVSLDKSLPDWIDDFHQKAGDRAEVRLQIERDVGAINADSTMLREALRNLVDNALRHGGPALSKIDISASRQNGHAVLSVRDNGQGIAPDDIQTATERFSQLSPTAGSGLGLPIVEAVATSHGGGFEIHALDPGLEVKIAIPSVAEKENPASPAFRMT